MKKHNHGKRYPFQAADFVLLVILTLVTLSVLIPFINVVAISFTSYREYLTSTFVLWPKQPTLSAYKELFKDSRILIGYKTTIVYVLIGVPLNLLLECSLAYALSRKGWVGRKALLFFVLVTMVFNGGIVPTYLVMKSLGLTNTIWSVIFGNACNTFNMILIYNYFGTMPEALSESASLDGASEWTIMFRIILPQAMRYIVPSLISELVIVVKDTTFAYVVNFPDLMQDAKVLISNYDALLSVYLTIAVIYILINYALNRLSVFAAAKTGTKPVLTR